MVMCVRAGGLVGGRDGGWEGGFRGRMVGVMLLENSTTVGILENREVKSGKAYKTVHSILHVCEEGVH